VNNFFDFFQPFLAAKGYRVPTWNIPVAIVYPLAALTEDVFLLVRNLTPSLVQNFSLKFTRRAVSGTSITAWFETDKARRLLGYTPLVSPMEARRRSIAFFDALKDLFPPGPYNYQGHFDCVDDGTDYRPSDPKYLARRKRNEEKIHGSRTLVKLASALAAMSGLGVVALVILGADKQKQPARDLAERIRTMLIMGYS